LLYTKFMPDSLRPRMPTEAGNEVLYNIAYQRGRADEREALARGDSCTERCMDRDHLLKDASLGLKVLYAIGKARSFTMVGKVKVSSWGKPVMERCESLIQEIDLYLLRDVRMIQSEASGDNRTEERGKRCMERHPEGGQCELREGHAFEKHLAGMILWPVQPMPGSERE
jgi:hypothetical protein